MIRVLCLAWLALLLPLAALAQPVRVTSGEHDGFTRLVLDYGSPQDWQVGRTLDGYALRLTGPTPTYDLTGVYDLIGRGRLAAVWVDPATQALRIGIGCACHAQPFEFRPGIVVIDLKDGLVVRDRARRRGRAGSGGSTGAAPPPPTGRACPREPEPDRRL